MKAIDQQLYNRIIVHILYALYGFSSSSMRFAVGDALMFINALTNAIIHMYSYHQLHYLT